MKTKLLIIEDNFSKFFATKQVLESQLKLEVSTRDIRSGRELVDAAAAFAPDMVMIRPGGGITGLLDLMKKRRINRRNTEITLLLTQDFDDEVMRRFADAVSGRIADAA